MTSSTSKHKGGISRSISRSNHGATSLNQAAMPDEIFSSRQSCPKRLIPGVTERRKLASLHVSSNSSWLGLSVTCADDGMRKLATLHVSSNSIELGLSVTCADDGSSMSENTPSPPVTPKVGVCTQISAKQATSAPIGILATGRKCANCFTEKTPLWRNGPFGAKTLCNACGVRFKLGKLQVSEDGRTLVTVMAPPKKSVASKKERPIKHPGPNTPPRLSEIEQARPLKASYKPLRQQNRITKKTTAPKITEFGQFKTLGPQQHPVLSDHDGALMLLLLSGGF
eukprot:CAMPEP_0114270712 /NCGR_PEP_ID=MMETSP0058-20121206/27403_1 /TAXON_ID=36894 /ORGANISM="Pyramimonas parkeae, CCMP726" /LENGTH=282 /DNA_ID=CAMNT_0001389505 /DNA_START=180 /DNA_END=1028 /DNA_ORIENTATION=+